MRPELEAWAVQTPIGVGFEEAEEPPIAASPPPCASLGRTRYSPEREPAAPNAQPSAEAVADPSPTDPLAVGVPAERHPEGAGAGDRSRSLAAADVGGGELAAPKGTRACRGCVVTRIETKRDREDHNCERRRG
jgi:hypothetical protein